MKLTLLETLIPLASASERPALEAERDAVNAVLAAAGTVCNASLDVSQAGINLRLAVGKLQRLQRSQIKINIDKSVVALIARDVEVAKRLERLCLRLEEQKPECHEAEQIIRDYGFDSCRCGHHVSIVYLSTEIATVTGTGKDWQ
jgi:hypothetical protein